MNAQVKQDTIKYSVCMSVWLLFISNVTATALTRDPIAQGPYLGQTPPGSTPKIFAPGLICKSGKEHRESNGTFSGNGRMFCFLNASGVYMTEQIEAGWMPLERM